MQPYPTKLSVKQTDRNNLESLIPCGDGEYKTIKINQYEARRNYLDLYAIGKVWVAAVSTALVGEKVNIVHVVKAVKSEGSPRKPSPMQYQDLPIYESPHSNYKEQQIQKCPEANVKHLHRFLYPHVKYYREKVGSAISNVHSAVMENYKSAKNTVNEKKEEFKQTMSDPENPGMRYAVVAAGSLTGYLIGARIHRRILSTTLGLLAASALTFPKETDDIYRSVAFYTTKTFVGLYNAVSVEHNMKFRELGACKDDLPPPSENRADVTKICPQDK